MQKTTYGLRHLPSGKILNVEVQENHDQEFCNAETCKLTLDDSDFDYVHRYETTRFADVVQATTNPDPGWYNSSRERPLLGEFDPDELHLVAFKKTYTFDALGGDPIATNEVVLPVTEPEFIKADIVGIRDPQKLPKQILKQDILQDHAAALDLIDYETEFADFVIVIPTEETPRFIEPGTCMLVSGNSCTILANTAVPDTWPVSERTDLTNARLLLVKLGLEPQYLDEFRPMAAPAPR